MRLIFPGGCLGIAVVTVLVSLIMGAMVEDYKEQIGSLINERDYWRGQYEVLANDYCRLEGAWCDK